MYGSGSLPSRATEVYAIGEVGPSGFDKPQQIPRVDTFLAKQVTNRETVLVAT